MSTLNPQPPLATAKPSWRPAKLIVLLALVLMAVPAVAAPAAAEAPASDSDSARYEVYFMTNMIDHHHMAVMMTGVCLQEEGIEPDLLAMCQTMMTDQSREISQMQTWLQDWYGIDHMPEMMPGHGQMMAELAALDGDEFEIEFLTGMAGHHFDAVKEGERCLRMASHDELLDLCRNIMASQLGEIADMRSMLCDWHGICRSRVLR